MSNRQPKSLPNPEGARFAERRGGRRFWGRRAELAMFRSLLRAASPPAVVFVHGLGGVGKSALLREFAKEASRAGIRVVRLDGRFVDPTPGGFDLALGEGIGAAAGEPPVAALRRARTALLIDSFELLKPIEHWLREKLLPQLHGRAIVVMASREPPGPEWIDGIDSAGGLAGVPLRNLLPADSAALLAERGVPASSHAVALEFTHGHPLALVLVAELMAAAGPGAIFNPAQAPNVVRALVERFVAGVPGPSHRKALELCAHARVTTESLIASLVDDDDPHALFEWLRRLSFVEEGPEGVFPHDVARAALDADFRWRDPEGYVALHRRIWLHAKDRLLTAAGRPQQRAFFDKLYLHRQNVVGARYHDYGTLGTIYAETAAPADHDTIGAVVRRHEGNESAAIASAWLRRQPAGFQVIRGGGGLLGFVATVSFGDPASKEAEDDPAVRAAWRFARGRRPLRTGERMIYHRFVMAADGYQQLSPAINLLAMSVTTAPIHEARLAWSFIAFADPDAWLPIMRYINFERAAGAGFTAGGRSYGVFAHDWRVETFDAWWEREARQSLAPDIEPQPDPGPPLVVLSEPDFAEWVRRALRDYAREAPLADSPLLRSRVVVEAAGARAGPADLRHVIRQAIERLKHSPRDEKFFRALWQTYIQAAPTQERAAERLGLPFNTYRYRLAQGTARVVEWLWQRELRGAAPETALDGAGRGGSQPGIE